MKPGREGIGISAIRHSCLYGAKALHNRSRKSLWPQGGGGRKLNLIATSRGTTICPSSLPPLAEGTILVTGRSPRSPAPWGQVQARETWSLAHLWGPTVPLPHAGPWYLCLCALLALPGMPTSALLLGWHLLVLLGHRDFPKCPVP